MQSLASYDRECSIDLTYDRFLPEDDDQAPPSPTPMRSTQTTFRQDGMASARVDSNYSPSMKASTRSSRGGGASVPTLLLSPRRPAYLSSQTSRTSSSIKPIIGNSNNPNSPRKSVWMKGYRWLVLIILSNININIFCSRLAIVFNRGVFFSRVHSFTFLFFVKITQFESFAEFSLRGLDVNRENQENKAPAKRKTNLQKVAVYLSRSLLALLIAVYFRFCSTCFHWPSVLRLWLWMFVLFYDARCVLSRLPWFILLDFIGFKIDIAFPNINAFFLVHTNDAIFSSPREDR